MPRRGPHLPRQPAGKDRRQRRLTVILIHRRFDESKILCLQLRRERISKVGGRAFRRLMKKTANRVEAYQESNSESPARYLRIPFPTRRICRASSFTRKQGYRVIGMMRAGSATAKKGPRAGARRPEETKTANDDHHYRLSRSLNQGRRRRRTCHDPQWRPESGRYLPGGYFR
jgi:hypothetical protein